MFRLELVPAVAVDAILQRTTEWRPILRGVVCGAVFLAVLMAVQWPFANFLMTPAARNWFFGAGYMDFSTPARSAYARYVFHPHESTSAQFWRGMLIATLTSCLMMWIGVRAGGWMRKVRR